MEMYEEKKSLEEMKNAADKQLIDLGLYDTVSKFLKTQEAKDVVDSIFTRWLESLRVYADKMLDVAHTATDEVLKATEQDKNDFVEVAFLDFKRSLAKTINELLVYAPP